MTDALTAHNASVTTATVAIQTMTISGRQVTLSVFRQLRREPLVTDDGTLNGQPWGVVNYNPDKCMPYDPAGTNHLHVVWQKGDELRRSCEEEPYRGPAVPPPDGLHEYLVAVSTAEPIPGYEGRRVHLVPPNGVTVSTRHVWTDWTLQLDGLPLWASWKSGPGEASPDHFPADQHAALTERASELHDTVLAGVQAERARRQALEARWSELLDLPQLFIAT
jgi:hypothetical protein